MEKQVKAVFFLVLLVFLVLWGRLFQLQILLGKENRFLAENNRIARTKIEAPRGLILDRQGKVLATNKPAYQLEEKLEEEGLKTISRDEALKRQAEGEDENLKIGLKREYPEGVVFAHALGYLGEVSQEELGKGKLELKGYSLGSLIGRSGLEEEYESLLRGREGSELVEVNTQGKVIRRMGQILPTPGKTITTALDKNLQKVAAEAMGRKKGAVVATNPQNGEVLLLYSSPSFDPAKLEEAITNEEEKPLLNRAISGLYPPGSTFKIVTAIAGLEEGKISQKTLINDPGVIYLGPFKYSNWYFTKYGATEGEINVVKALARSTDTYFYKLGEMLGIEKLNFWAEKFRVAQKFGIDLPGEIDGFIATPEWKQKIKGEPWFLGNTYHISIGQGDLDLTPLGVNMLTAVIANQGKICRPRMLKLGAENTPYQAECKEIGIKKENIEIVKEGMIGACSPGGTAGVFFDFEAPGLPAGRQVACKTGTAEVGDNKETHAWFTVFAPVKDPEIVLTVLVERGGEGSSVAAPIAREILEEWFKR